MERTTTSIGLRLNLSDGNRLEITNCDNPTSDYRLIIILLETVSENLSSLVENNLNVQNSPLLTVYLKENHYSTYQNVDRGNATLVLKLSDLNYLLPKHLYKLLIFHIDLESPGTPQNLRRLRSLYTGVEYSSLTLWILSLTNSHSHLITSGPHSRQRIGSCCCDNRR